MPAGSKKILALLSLLLLGFGAACHPSKTKEKILASPDGDFQISVPSAWKVENDLNDVAEIQAAHRLSDMYVVVIRDYREDLFEMTLPKYAEITQKSLLEEKKDPRISDPISLTIGGHPALQYQIRAAHEHTRIVYLVTVVETSQHYYQILTWTIPSRWEKNRRTLEEITKRFRENTSKPDPTPAGSFPSEAVGSIVRVFIPLKNPP